MQILSAAFLTAALAARYPNPAPEAVGGTIDISASEENIGTVQAAAVRGFQANPGKLEWVRANEHFFEAGEIVHRGDYVQLKADVAKALSASGRGTIVTEDEVKSASKAVDVQASETTSPKGKK